MNPARHKLYFYLQNPDMKYLVFHNPRCACTTVKQWHSRVIHPTLTDTFVDHTKIKYSIDHLEEHPDWKRILVVRDPVDRLVSVMNHSIVSNYIQGWNELPKAERIERFIELIDNGGRVLDPHFQQQYIHRPGFFTDIVRIEDGNLIERLNELTGAVVPDIHANVTAEKRDIADSLLHEGARHGYNKKRAFDYAKFELMTRADLNDKHLGVIWREYYNDFSYYAKPSNR